MSATIREFLKKTTSMGVTASELPKAVSDYGNKFGFEQEGIPFSVNNTLELAKQNLINTLTMEQSSLIRNVLTEEEIVNSQNNLFQNNYQNMGYSKDAYDRIKEVQYSYLSPAQILNENTKILNYEPWLREIPDRSATPIEYGLGFINKVGTTGMRIAAGATSLAYDSYAWYVDKRYKHLKNINHPDAEKFEGLSKRTYKRSDELYQMIMRGTDNVDEFVTGNIPNYIKDDFGYMVAESMGELPLMAVGFIPYVGMPLLGASTVSRYYQEGLEESGGNEKVAGLYTSIFAPLSFMIDRITLGIPKKLNGLKTNPNFNRKDFIMKGIGLTTKRGLKSGSLEFLTETAESAYLQKVTKGTVDWKQARLEGLLAFIVGTTGASTVGTISIAKNNKHINKLKSLGMDENTAVGVIDLINEGDQAAANDVVIETISEQLNKLLGNEFSILGNSITGNGKYKKYTFGLVRQIAKKPRSELIELLDTKNEQGEFLINRKFRDEAEIAFLDPTQENVDALNKKIEQVSKEDTAFTETTQETTQETVESLQQRQDELNEQRKNIEDKQSDEARAIDFEIQKVVNRKKILEFEAIINNPNTSNKDKSFAYLQLKGLFGDRRKQKIKNVEIDSKEAAEANVEYYESMVTLYEGWSFVNPNADIFKGNPSEIINTNKRLARQFKEDVADFNTQEVTQETNYDNLSFKQLRELGNQRGIKGRSKKDLIEKLTNQDANQIDSIIDQEIQRQREGIFPEEQNREQKQIQELELLLQQKLTNDDIINKLKNNANLDTLATLQAIETVLGFTTETSSRISEDRYDQFIETKNNPIYRKEVIRRANLLKQFLFENNSPLISRMYAKDILDTFVVSVLNESTVDPLINESWNKRQVEEGYYQKRIDQLFKTVIPYIKSGDKLGLTNAFKILDKNDNPVSELFKQQMENTLIKVEELNKAYKNNSLNFFMSKEIESLLNLQFRSKIINDKLVIGSSSSGLTEGFISEELEARKPSLQMEIDLVTEILTGNVAKKELKDQLDKELKDDKIPLTEEEVNNLSPEEQDKLDFEEKLNEFNSEVNSIFNEIKTEMPIFDRELSNAEQKQFIRYILYKQGFTKIQTGVDKDDNPVFEELTEIKEEDLSKDLFDYIEAARIQFDLLADEFEKVNEILGIDFNRSEWYFPLKRDITNEQEQKEISDLNELVDQHKGFTIGRTGSTIGIKADPVFQVEETMMDIIKTTRVGIRQKELTDKLFSEDQIQSLVNALDKIKANIDVKIVDTDMTQEQIKQFELTDKESLAYELFKELNILEKTKLENKIPSSRNPVLSPTFLKLVSEHKNNTLSQDLANIGDIGFVPDGAFKNWLIKNGQSWANIVDPHFIVQKMDGSSLVDNVDEDGKVIGGKLYSSNAVMWHQILRAVNLARQEDIQLQRFQQSILENFNEKQLNNLNLLLHNVFFKNEKSKKVLKQISNLTNAKQLREKLKKEGYAYNQQRITLKESEIILAYAKLIRGRTNRILLGTKRRGQLANISSDKKRRFFALERKVEEGNATLEDLAEYKALGATQGEQTQIDVFRKIHRFMFEQQAIDNKNFFGWFEGTMAQANKGAFFDDIIDQVEVWADYLQSQGEEGNANWWRTKVEVNLKGNLFKFENQLLGWTASNIKKFATKVSGSDQLNLENDKLPTGILNAIKASSIEDIKLGVINAGSWLQKARINAFLLGNIGWVLTTQPSSLAFTIKQVGVKEALKQFGLQPDKGAIVLLDPEDRKYLGEDVTAESQVVGIKRSGKEVTAVEATDPLREDNLIKTKRQIARNGLGALGSWMENRLTLASFNAGFNHAKNKLGLNDDQAAMHGDFVAATTQSMYDRISRNSALNSNVLRFFRPMQSFVFTAYSNVLDTFGKVGVKRSAKVRLAEAGRFLLASRMWQIMWSYIFGDDLLKAIYNPQFDKGTLGSAIPLFGLDVDIKISQSLPWLDDQGWKDNNAQQQFMKQTMRIMKGVALDQPNAERELLIYTFRYITPSLGIGAGVPLQNLTKLISAKLNNNTFEDIKGGEMSALSNNYLTYPLGLFFGRKIMDAREITTLQRLIEAREKAQENED